MIRRRILPLLLAATLAGCAVFGDDDDDAPAPLPAGPVDPMVAANWQLGPIINGERISRGVPLTPSPHPDGWSIDIPAAPGSVHYVTMPSEPLIGKTRLVMRFRVELAPGAAIVPRDQPTLTGMLTPYFERRRLGWSAAYEAWRWYAAPPARVRPLAAGSYEVIVSFAALWTGVLGSTNVNNPTAFAAARADTGRVGFVLGGGDGVGHGVHATGPARIVVTLFKVE